LFTRKSLGDWSYDASVIFRRNDRVNTHKNARLTIEGRKLLIERIAVVGLRAAAEAAGVSLRTARKWLARFQVGGVAALGDRSSRPARVRSSIDEPVLQWIEQLRRLRMPMRRIAELVGRSVSTVSRWLARLGLSSLRALDPVRRSFATSTRPRARCCTWIPRSSAASCARATV